MKQAVWSFLLVILFAMNAFAGPLVPCVKAAASKHRAFLVITEMQLAGKEGDSSRLIEGITFEVLPQEKFVNAIHRPITPLIFWADGVRWRVVLNRDESRMFGCPVPIVTDDGEFLLVLHSSPGDPALSIYRRPDYPGSDHGTLIKTISLKEIWPAARVETKKIYTDHTPLWYASGRFDFSLDSRILIHTTRWGNTVRINLNDGSVTKANAAAR